MGYSRETYENALDILRGRKRDAELEAKEKTEAFYALQPRARQIERELASTAIGAAKAVLSGESAAKMLAALKERNLALQEERRTLLHAEGLSEDDLKPPYTCLLYTSTLVISFFMRYSTFPVNLCVQKISYANL